MLNTILHVLEIGTILYLLICRKVDFSPIKKELKRLNMSVNRVSKQIENGNKRVQE